MLYAVSLFSGAGIGDLGVHYGARVPVRVACELNRPRAAMLRAMLPGCEVVVGDIRERLPEVLAASRRVQASSAGEPPFVVSITAPCQGMSTLNAISEPTPRSEKNALVFAALDAVAALRPAFVVIENVAQMSRAVHAPGATVLDSVVARLEAEGYASEHRVVHMCEYGVPQRRVRLFVVARRHDVAVRASSLFPASDPGAPRTVRDAIFDLPPLSAQCRASAASDVDPLHRVPVWDHATWFAIHHTPEGRSAHDNRTCVECGYEASRDAARYAAHCSRCRALLPIPTCEAWECAECGHAVSYRYARCTSCKKGVKPERLAAAAAPSRRRVKSFGNTFMRMRFDEPAPTLTTLSGVTGTGCVVHPTQDRVLSIREVLRLSTITGFDGFDPPWGLAAEAAITKRPARIRKSAGEAVPPLFMWRLVAHLRATALPA